MPTALRSRRLLVALVALVLAALVVVSLPDHSEPRDDVGTEGDGTERRVSDRASSPDSADPAEDEGAPAPTDSVIAAGPTTTTAPTSGRSSSTTSPITPPAAATATTPKPAPRTVGGRLVYGGKEAGSLWSTRLDGSDLRAEVACGGGGHFGPDVLDVSPDGTLLLRSCGPRPAEGADPALDRYELTVQEVATGRARTLWSNGDAWTTWYGRWSPDGRSVAVQRIEEPGIRIIDVHTGSSRTIAPELTARGVVTSWSPDGTKLLLSDEILIVDVATGDLTELTDQVALPPGASEHQVREGRWAPDGSIYVNELTVDDAGVHHSYVTRFFPAEGRADRIFDAGSTVSIYLIETLPDGRVLIVTGTLRFPTVEYLTFSIQPDGTDRVEIARPDVYAMPVLARPAPSAGGLPTTG